MASPEYIPLAVALIGAIVGGLVVHLLTSRRDRLNKRRDKRIDYLIQAYRRFESCAHRQWSEDNKVAAAEVAAVMSELESAVADIQLFGSSLQVKLAQDFSRQFAGQRGASFDKLLDDLRSDLRAELDLEAVPQGILHLRWKRTNEPRA